MKEPYTPKGKVRALLDAVQADPMREFASQEVAGLMDCDKRAVAAHVENARRARMVFVRKEGRHVFYRGTPYDDQELQDAARQRSIRAASRTKPADGWVTTYDDVRVPKVVPGWKPPAMVCVRGGV